MGRAKNRPRIIKQMPQPIKVRGRFATAQDTAKTLGVSASRTKELIELARKFTGEIRYRSANSNWAARKKMRTGPSATAVRTKKSGRHAGAAKKKNNSQLAKAHR